MKRNQTLQLLIRRSILSYPKPPLFIYLSFCAAIDKKLCSFTNLMCLPAILSDITGFSKKLKLVYEQNSANIQMKTSNVATTNEEQ